MNDGVPRQPNADDDESAARRIAGSLAEGTVVTREEFALLRRKLLIYLHRSGIDVGSTALADIVDAGVENFLIAAKGEGRIRPETALAYLRRTVRNAAIDHLRRRSREVPLQEQSAELPDGDDAIARFVSSHADAKSIEAIQRAAARALDHTTTRVINAYLDLAESRRCDPSSRMVAKYAGVSHTTVNKVLAALKEQLNIDVSEFPDG